MSDPVADALVVEFTALHRRFRDLVTTLDPADLNRAPAPGENSIGVLVKHALGAERMLLLADGAGRTVHRVRDEEFRGQMTKDEIFAWLDAADRDVAETVAFALRREKPAGATGRSPAEAVVHACTHAAEHLAQAELTRTLLSARK